MEIDDEYDDLDEADQDAELSNLDGDGDDTLFVTGTGSGSGSGSAQTPGA